MYAFYLNYKMAMKSIGRPELRRPNMQTSYKTLTLMEMAIKHYRIPKTEVRSSS